MVYRRGVIDVLAMGQLTPAPFDARGLGRLQAHGVAGALAGARDFPESFISSCRASIEA